MAINFAAESMQGYNNPKIEIVNAEVDKNGTLITQITFDDIAKILARGCIPVFVIMECNSGQKRTRCIMHLASAQDDEILFSTIVMNGTSESPSSIVFGFKFVTSGPPLPLRMPLKGSIS